MIDNREEKMSDAGARIQLDAAVLAAHSQQKSAENFASSIKKFVNYVSATPNTTLSLIHLCKEFHFQRRRFYDVINVLEALEVCRKTGVDEMIWYGKSHFKKLIDEIRGNGQVIDRDIDQCISISGLTTRFIRAFFYFKSQTINIKEIGSFLSRENGRTKTTTCKLYQISHILEAAGIVEKTVLPGEIKLIDEYYLPEQTKVPFTIAQLLNAPAPIKPIAQASTLLDEVVLSAHVSA